MRTVALRVSALALLLLLALFAAIAIRTMQRLPDMTLYFVQDGGAAFTLQPEYRRVGRLSVDQRVARQVAALAAGPDGGQRLSSAVPAGTVLLGARLDGAVLTVDLSDEFQQGGGTASMLGRLNQLYYTLTQPADVDAVRLLIGGEELHVFSGEGLLLEQPWRRAEHAALPVW